MTKNEPYTPNVVSVPTLADILGDPPQRLGLRTFRDGGAWQKHAGNIMHVLFLWTKIDVEKQRLLLPMMDAEHALVARMVGATRNVDTALVAAAGARLEPEQRDLVTGILGDIGHIRSRRNIYVHWVAAHTKDPRVVDKVLFIDPAHLSSVHAAVHADSRSTLEDEQFPAVDPRFVLVFDEEAISEDRYIAANALGALRLLRFHLLEPQDSEIHEKLLRRRSDLKRTHYPSPRKI